MKKTSTKIDPQQIADDLIWHLDEWYSLPETFDNELDTQIHRWYANAPQVWPKRPYFSPSAANACPRELYYKQLRAPKDSTRKQPHQGRWQEIGTRIGDMIQRTILAIERNMEDKTGISPRFRFERTENGEPAFEEFIKKNHRVEHKGKTFYLFGTSDGIMKYVTKEGEKVRVGLEIKSKQTTPARTSLYSMRAPQEDHVKQCVTYAEMYDLDYFVILYVNAAKKTWEFDSLEEYEKNPDIRAFGIQITEEDKAKVFDRFVAILDAVERKEPPMLDVDGWNFNPYKTVIAEEISREELDELRRMRDVALKSRMPEYKKRPYVEVVDFIENHLEEMM